MAYSYRKSCLPEALIRKALEPFGAHVDHAMAAKISKYVDLLLQWNQKISLTTITDPSEVLTRHFGESMCAAPMVRHRDCDGVLVDVGSGAGFPGLALKLVCPILRVHLVESNGKKAVFLAEVVRALDLKDVEVLRCRLESIREFRADIMTARAIRASTGVLDWAAQNVVQGGQTLLWVGRLEAERLAETVGWEWSPPVAIPGSINRVVLSGLRTGSGGPS